MEPDHKAPLEHGDRVAAARDLETTQGIHIPAGTFGTVAEERGSKLVVFFNEEKVANVEEQDLTKLED